MSLLPIIIKALTLTGRCQKDPPMTWQEKFDEQFRVIVVNSVGGGKHGISLDLLEKHKFYAFITTEIIEKIIDDIPELTEGDGWEMLGDGCCPGDDFADGWNQCRAKLINIIKEKEKEKE